MFAKEVLDLAERVLAACRARGLKVTVAESCTGGLITAVLTAIPGSSDVIERSFVTYTNLSKNEMLGVPGKLFAEVGAVSEPVARAMAEGALRYSDADLAASVTGVAGPDGGTPEKPVGLVHMAVSLREKGGLRTVHEDRTFQGDRAAVRLQAAVRVLELMEDAAQP